MSIRMEDIVVGTELEWYIGDKKHTFEVLEIGAPYERPVLVSGRTMQGEHRVAKRFRDLTVKNLQTGEIETRHHPLGLTYSLPGEA